VKVLGAGSKVFDWSCTEKVKLPYGEPFSPASGTNFSAPAAICSAVTSVAGAHRVAVELQRAVGGQAVDAHRLQRITHVQVGETEVGGDSSV
jgi:hypothetical protein